MKNIILLCSLFLYCSAHAQIITTIAGDGISAYTGNGIPATASELGAPYGLSVDLLGNLYIADSYSNTIRRISTSGIITTVAGNGTPGYSGDGALAIDAQLNSPIDVVIDKFQNIYIADLDNDVVRKVDSFGIITTIAGTGDLGYNGDNIPATSAELTDPYGVAVDSIGNIYIADGNNHRIRKVDTGGMITTFAGTGISGFSPDGSLIDTMRLGSLVNIRIDRGGLIYIFDSFRIRRINGSRIITTIAGNGINGYGGDSGPATDAEISGGAIALDTAGNLYIADGDNNRIRKVELSGVINTIAGSGAYGFSGDGGNPLTAKLAIPLGVALNSVGDIFISDVGNGRIRLITKNSLLLGELTNPSVSISVFPNPSNGHFFVTIVSAINDWETIIVTNSLGEKVKEFTATANQTFEIQLDLPKGVYSLSLYAKDETITKKIIIQ